MTLREPPRSGGSDGTIYIHFNFWTKITVFWPGPPERLKVMTVMTIVTGLVRGQCIQGQALATY